MVRHLLVPRGKINYQMAVSKRLGIGAKEFGLWTGLEVDWYKGRGGRGQDGFRRTFCFSNVSAAATCAFYFHAPVT